MPSRSKLAGALLLVAAACAGLPCFAQNAAEAPVTLEVTWKSNTDGRGAAAGIFAHLEVIEHYQVVSCYDQEPPHPERIQDGDPVSLCLRFLDGHFLRTEGHGAGNDQKPVYEYVGAPRSDHPILIGNFEENVDGTVHALLHLSDHLNLANGSAEESCGCGCTGWPVPKMSYAELRNLRSLDRTWEESAVTDAAMLESCQPGNISVRLHGSGNPCIPLKTACDHAHRWIECAQTALGDLIGDLAQGRAEASVEKATQAAQNVPNLPWYEQFVAALDQVQQKVTGAQGEVGAFTGDVTTACASLPGPDDANQCRQEAQPVDDLVKKSRETLDKELEQEISLFEAGTPLAAGSVARTKLLVNLRKQMTALNQCQF